MPKAWTVAGCALLVAACSDREDEMQEAAAIPDCERRCLGKIAECELMVGDATVYCEEFCDEGLAAPQLDCYAEATCEALWYGSHGCLTGLHCAKLTCECDGAVHTGHFERYGQCAPSCAEVCAEFRAAESL